MRKTSILDKVIKNQKDPKLRAFLESKAHRFMWKKVTYGGLILFLLVAIIGLIGAKDILIPSEISLVIAMSLILIFILLMIAKVILYSYGYLKTGYYPARYFFYKGGVGLLLFIISIVLSIFLVFIFWEILKRFPGLF